MIVATSGAPKRTLEKGILDDDDDDGLLLWEFLRARVSDSLFLIPIENFEIFRMKNEKNREELC